MSLLSESDPPLRGKATEMLRACRNGSIRQLQYCYRYFDIPTGSAPLTYPASAAPLSSSSTASESSPSPSRPASPVPYLGPPSTHSLLATAIAHHQPLILSDLLQTFPSAPVTPQLLELCIAEGSVACLDLLLMHDRRAIDTCVATFEGDGVGASLLACVVQVDADMALCLLHHGASVGGEAGSYGGIEGVGLVRLAMRRGAGGGGDGHGEGDGEGGDDDGAEGGVAGCADKGPDIELVRELIRRGASVEGALEEAVELGPDFVAAVLGGKPRPSAREIREALGRAKRAELVILKEKMEAKKRASMESLRGEEPVNGGTDS